jgi:hypothetical protein
MSTTPVFMPPRFQEGPVSTALQLGPLASLAGSWKGTGFNQIWRPDNPASQPVGGQTKRFLELNLTSETLDFHVIPGAIPNRGLNPQVDLSLYGLHYLQRVTDADLPPFETAGQALHIEPGLFMRVPASVIPSQPASIARLASIPHGVAVLMQGLDPGTTPTPGAPTIPPIFPIAGLPTFTPASPAVGLGIQPTNIFPGSPPNFEHQVPEVVIASDVAGTQSTGPFPASFQDLVNDPNSLLRSAIAGQDILGFIAINLSTTGVGSGLENTPYQGLANIPFLGLPSQALAAAPNPAPNAFVLQAAATFWIEWVKLPGGPALGGKASPEVLKIEPFFPVRTYLQLQYSQMSILVFNGVLWPHVNVATLTLSNG